MAKSMVAVGDFWSSNSMETHLASSACDERFLLPRGKGLWVVLSLFLQELYSH